VDCARGLTPLERDNISITKRWANVILDHEEGDEAFVILLSEGFTDTTPIDL
jgi:hypothetical protein